MKSIFKHSLIYLLVLLFCFSLSAWAAEESVNYRSPIDVAGSELIDYVYVADATNNTIEIVSDAGALLGQLSTSQRPNALLLSADASYLYIATGSESGKVEVFDTAANEKVGEVAVGHTPSALALSQDGNTLYAANRFNGTVQPIALENGVPVQDALAGDALYVTREPMSMAVLGNKLYVGGHLPTGSMTDANVSSEVAVVDTSDMTVSKIITMVNGSTNLKDIALSPDGKYLYVSHTIGRYNVATTHADRGWIYSNAITEIQTSDDTVRATMLVDDLDLGAGNPWGIDVSADKIVLAVSGTRELMILDRIGLREKIENVYSNTLGGKGFLEEPEDISVDLTFTTAFKKRIDLGQDGPRGIALISDKVYVANYYSGSISIYDISEARKKTVRLTTSKQEDDVRAGERLWNDATICFGQWQSCASCHADARVDGLNWDNMNDGIGTPKQARSLVGSWDRGRVMATGIRPSTKAANRAGLKYICFNDGFPESEFEKIDAYTKSLKPEASPYLENGKLSESALRGKHLFDSKANCASCHGGDLYGADILIYENYVKSETETRGLLVPPLIEAWRTAPYLHDGSAATIMDVLTTRNVTGTHGNTAELTEAELADLCNYVLSLGTDAAVIAPDTIQGASIRTTEPQGMRFAAYVDDTRKSQAYEYGFIVALDKSFASEKEYTKLVFDGGESTPSGTNEYGITYVSGKAYLTAEPGKSPSVNLIYSLTGEEFGLDKAGTYYTVLLKGIEEENYGEAFVARPYLRTEDGIFYGASVVRSIKQIAFSIVDKEYGGNLKLAPEYIQKICNHFWDEITDDEAFIDMEELLNDVKNKQLTDIETVRSMNLALSSAGEIAAAADLMTVLDKAGFDTEQKRTPVLSGYNFYWYQPVNQIVYVNEQDDNFNLIFPEEIEGFPAKKDNSLTPLSRVVDLVMFMGQSNMAGRGDASLAPSVPEGTAFEFRAMSDPTGLYPVSEPFGVKENNNESGVTEPTKSGSMVSAFVNAYYEETGVPIVAVSCSKGGTTIKWWQPNGGPLNDAIARHATAKEWLEANGYTIRRDFMVWCQGESDGDNGNSASYYKGALTNVISAMMEEGIEKCFVIRIGNHRDNATLYDPIIFAQTEYCKENENAVLVSTALAGFAAEGLMKDAYHYTQEGYNLAGAEAGKNTAYYINTGEEPSMYDPEYDNIFRSDNKMTRAEFVRQSMYLITKKQKIEDVLKIGCLGDSLTMGGIGYDGNYTGEESYTRYLSEILGEGYDVKNFGISSHGLYENHQYYYKNTGQYAQSLEYEPELIIFFFGTNDAKKQYWPDIHDDYEQIYKGFLEEIFEKLDSSPSVILGTPPPVVGGGFLEDRPEENMTELREIIRKVAKDCGYSIADTYTDFVGKKEMFPDGIHWSVSASRIVAEKFAEIILDGNMPETAFDDVQKSDWFYWIISNAEKSGILHEKDGAFCPDDTITRQDAAVIIYNVINKFKTISGSASFDDFDEISDFAKEPVSALVENGIMDGDGTNFNPKDALTNDEAMKIIDNALNFITA